MCVSPSVREHNEAFVSDVDIMVNLFTMQEQFHRTFSKKELHMLLLLDCAKGFNLLSHKWLERVLRHAMLPNVLIPTIHRLIFRQVTFVLFSGIVLDSVSFLSGLRQGGPLSGLLFDLACACLLISMALVAGVIFVKAFCDDFQSLVKGLRAIRNVLRHVQEFEDASGLRIHRTKSKFVPSRKLTSMEKSQFGTDLGERLCCRSHRFVRHADRPYSYER